VPSHREDLSVEDCETDQDDESEVAIAVGTFAFVSERVDELFSERFHFDEEQRLGLQ